MPQVKAREIGQCPPLRWGPSPVTGTSVVGLRLDSGAASIFIEGQERSDLTKLEGTRTVQAGYPRRRSSAASARSRSDRLARPDASLRMLSRLGRRRPLRHERKTS